MDFCQRLGRAARFDVGADLMLTLTNEATNIVMDGNSLIFGNSTTVPERIGEQLMQLAPINGAMTYKNVALGGATFRSMVSGTDGSGITGVNAAFEAGKQNILFVLEAVNTALTARPNGAACTAADIIQDCKDYTAAVKAGHPEWRIYLIIAPAYKDDATYPSVGNAAIDGYNAYVRSNYADLGAEGFVETRPPGGPLAYTDYRYTETTFKKSGNYADDVHLSGAGNAIVSQYAANTVMTIPDVAPGAAAVLRKAARVIGGKLRLRNGAPLVAYS